MYNRPTKDIAEEKQDEQRRHQEGTSYIFFHQFLFRINMNIFRIFSLR